MDTSKRHNIAKPAQQLDSQGNPRGTWIDISHETFRTYFFPNGEYTIKEPVWLLVTTDHSHRVVDSTNKSHYIRNTFISITWDNVDNQPFLPQTPRLSE